MTYATAFRMPIGDPERPFLGVRSQEDNWHFEGARGQAHGDYFSGSPMRGSGQFHHLGEDWNWGSGRDDVNAPIHAVGNGVVIYVGAPWQTAALSGHMVIMRHELPPGSDDGHGGRFVYSLYAHITPVEGLAVGQTMAIGEQVGVIADLAAGSFSPHLHFEMRWLDPAGIPDTITADYVLPAGYIGTGYFRAEGTANAAELANAMGWYDPSDFIESRLADGDRDDFAADPSTAGLLEIGVVNKDQVWGVLEERPAGQFDTDWFAVDLVAGRTYTFAMRGTDTADQIQGAPTLANPSLRIRDPQGNQITWDGRPWESGQQTADDGAGGRDVRVSFTATETGRHHLVAFSASGATGSYRLSGIESTGQSADPLPFAIERVSVASDGTQAHSVSTDPALSGDGRFVAFASSAPNLVPGDTNDAPDIFVHDRQTGETTRVSVASDGSEANSFSQHPVISADGRFVFFESWASNLVPGGSDIANGIYVHDRLAGETTLVSVASDGTAANAISWSPAISPDGRFIAFVSEASSLLQVDQNNEMHVFVHDRQTGETSVVSIASDGTLGNGPSFSPAISADGRFVAFESFSSNLLLGLSSIGGRVYIHDRDTGETSMVSVSGDGTPSDGIAGFPGLSADGRFVTFHSRASNLVPDDTNQEGDIFVHDRLTGETSRVSVASVGTEANAGSAQQASISGDGRFVVFGSFATNLAPGDTNPWQDIFVHDRTTGQTRRASVAQDGTQSNSGSYTPVITADGRYIVFQSSASNLVPGDTNGIADIFVVTNPLFGGGAAGSDAENRAPEIVPNWPDARFIALSEVELDVGRFFSDPDGDALTFTVTGLPEGLVLSGDGIIRGTASAAPGSYPVRITADDGNGGTASRSWVVAIVNSPDATQLEYAAKVIAYGSDALAPLGGYFIQQEFLNGTFRAVALQSQTGEPILAVRGTSDGLLDWYENAHPQAVGYREAIENWSAIRAWLEANPGAHITGHSQGGAQAQMFAAWATRDGIEIGRVETFNSPGIAAGDALAFNPARAGQVTHHISQGDVVSKAGEQFLAGQVNFYKIQGITDIRAPWGIVETAHVGHGAMQPGSSFLVGFGENYRLADALSTTALSSPSFSYVWSRESPDAEYFSFVMLLGAAEEFIRAYGSFFSVSPVEASDVLPTVSWSLLTRGGTEALRSEIGTWFSDLFNRPTFDIGAASRDLFAAIYDTAHTWGSALAETATWTAETIWAMQKASIDFWVAMASWSAETIANFALWSLDQIGNALLWPIHRVVEMAEWTSAAWNASVGWGADMFAAVGQFGVDGWQRAVDFGRSVNDAVSGFGESVYSNVMGTAESIGNWVAGATPAIFRYGVDTTPPPVASAIVIADVDGSTMLSGPGSLYFAGPSADHIILQDSGNVIFGSANGLNNDRITGFGPGDRIVLLGTTLSEHNLRVEVGSAILRIDSDDDGMFDTTLRLDGAYDITAFQVASGDAGTVLTYAPHNLLTIGLVDRAGAPMTDVNLRTMLPDGTVTEIGRTDAVGQLVFSPAGQDEIRLTGSKPFDPVTEGSITAGNALDVLRLAVGLSPSWGPAGPMDFIAADIDQDGRVTAADALDVLRAAVGLESANNPRWIFIDSDADMFGITANNSVVEEGVRFDPMAPGFPDLSMTGVLLGSMQEYAQ